MQEIPQDYFQNLSSEFGLASTGSTEVSTNDIFLEISGLDQYSVLDRFVTNKHARNPFLNQTDLLTKHFII